MVLWDGWLRGQSLKAIGRAFGKPSSLFIACWPPVLRRPVEITGVKRTCPGLVAMSANDPKTTFLPRDAAVASKLFSLAVRCWH